jgi:hypothetical protein
MTKHTPGPWSVAVGPAMLADNGLASLGRLSVVAATAVLYDNLEADARLIAAAPDLLAVARAVVELMGHLYPTAAESVDMSGLESALLFGARTAIAKAEGGGG